jgi:hypothetical protein
MRWQINNGNHSRNPCSFLKLSLCKKFLYQISAGFSETNRANWHSRDIPQQVKQRIKC